MFCYDCLKTQEFLGRGPTCSLGTRIQKWCGWSQLLLLLLPLLLSGVRPAFISADETARAPRQGKKPVAEQRVV